MKNKTQKPPLGIMPERLWKEARAWDLIEALARHRNYSVLSGGVIGHELPEEAMETWLEELHRLLGEILRPPLPQVGGRL